MDYSRPAASEKGNAAVAMDSLENTCRESTLREQCATALVASLLIAIHRRRKIRSGLYGFPKSATTAKWVDIALMGLPGDTEKKVTVALSIGEKTNVWRTILLRTRMSDFHPVPGAPHEVFACADSVLRSSLTDYEECAAASPNWCGGATAVNSKPHMLDFSSTTASWEDQIEPLLSWLSELSWAVEFCTIKEHMPASLHLTAKRYHLIWQDFLGNLYEGRSQCGSFLIYTVPLIPFAKFPPGNQLHRYEGKDRWERDREQRLRLIWRGLDVNAKGSVVAPSNISSCGTTESKITSKSISKDAHVSGYSPVLRILLIGHLDENSPLSKLPTCLLRRIYLEYKGLIHRLLNPCPGVFASIVGKVEKWPEYTGLNINMMPIRIGDLTSLPDSCKQYGAILASLPLSRGDYTIGGMDGYEGKAKIGFLTIHESVIETDGESQRRGGVHTETPGRIWLNSKDGTLASSVKGNFDFQVQAPITIAWGKGSYSETFKMHYEYNGGLYMGSNVAGSTKVWGNAQIKCPEEVVGRLGDLEYLRHYLGGGSILDAGDIVWMTDTTPHESLPLPVGTRRQYFRLVTNHVNVWYEDHSTKNPLGVVPNPNLTKIVKGNKFEN